MMLKLRGMDYEARRNNPCIGRERADLVLAGCAVFEAIRREWQCERLRVADRGLREGILMQLMRADGYLRGRAAAAAARRRAAGHEEGGARRRAIASCGTRLKTAQGRKLSSQRWLERQLNDPYVARSKREGYRSRAAYKLIEIDDRFGLLKPGRRVVDLGAAPGGWSQVAAARVGSADAAAASWRIDYLDVDPLPGVDGAAEGFPRSRGARTADRRCARRREGRRRPLRHGRADDRSPRDRPSAHRGALRGGGGLRPRGAAAGRRRSSPRCSAAARRTRCSPT